MRIIVTGASGHIGTSLVRRLSRSHHVLGMSRDAAIQSRSALADSDVVVNLSWVMQPREDPDVLWKHNVLGTRRLAEAAAFAGVRQFVHLSSAGVYEPRCHTAWVDESEPRTGNSHSGYSLAKAAAEASLDALEDTMAIARLRPALALQKNAASEVTRYVLARFLPTWLAHPQVVNVPWPTGMVLQFVHVDDVVAAIERVIMRRVGGAFNLAADPPVDEPAMSRILQRVAPDVPPTPIDHDTWLSWEPYVQPRDGGWLSLAMRAPLVRSDRARRELGWVPQHSPVEALEAYVRTLACSARTASAETAHATLLAR